MFSLHFNSCYLEAQSILDIPESTVFYSHVRMLIAVCMLKFKI